MEEVAMNTDRSLSRRRFLETAGAGALAAPAAGEARPLWPAGGPAEKPRGTADTLIVLWMAGGMAHTETFDPKRYTPFEKGMESEARPQHVSRHRHGGRSHQVFARDWKRSPPSWIAARLIRSYTAGDLGFILHSRHQYQWHTGYAPPQTVAAPHIGRP